MGLRVPQKTLSPWEASNVFVKNKDVGLRVTSDFRALNYTTIFERGPIEDLRHVLEWISSKNTLSLFDLKHGFFQSKWKSNLVNARRFVLLLVYYSKVGYSKVLNPHWDASVYFKYTIRRYERL